MKFGQQRYGLGASFVDTAPGATETFNIASGLIPKGSGAQTDVGKGAGIAVTLSSGAVAITTAATSSSLAPIVATIAPGFGPAAPVVLAVAGLIGVAATVINAIWGSSQDKADREAAGKYQEVNSQYLTQIRQVDTQIQLVQDGLIKLGRAVGLNGLAGLSCNCGLGDGAMELNNAIGANSILKKQLNDKVAYLQALIKRFYQIVDAISVKPDTTIFKYILGGALLIGATWFGVKKLKNKAR